MKVKWGRVGGQPLWGLRTVQSLPRRADFLGTFLSGWERVSCSKSEVHTAHLCCHPPWCDLGCLPAVMVDTGMG